MLGAALTACLSLSAQDTAQHIVPGRKNSAIQQQQPYVIMISVDGFRYDYAEKFQATNILRLSADGVRATAMQPSYPTLTFPNHYTLATGLYPAHHGLVDNGFFAPRRNQEYRMSNRDVVLDSSWYGGIPLWVLAEQQKMMSASYFWVASETAIQGVRPSYYYNYHQKTSIDKRIQQVVDWLKMPEEKRPHLIFFYFPEVDHMGHYHGPDGDSTGIAVRSVDESIGKMVAAVNRLQLPVNFILVSDHGMEAVDTTHTLTLPDAPELRSLRMSPGPEKIMLYGKNEADIQTAYRFLKQQDSRYRVYLKQETPARWHYGQEDQHQRIGDIVIIADPGYVFHQGPRRVVPGHHGFDNNLANMNAIFMAWGPAFKPQTRIPTFANIHVYPLVAKILGLQVTTPVDGELSVLQPILK